MKTLHVFVAVTTALSLSFPALTCEQTVVLQGTVSIAPCDEKVDTGKCVPATKAVYDALEALEIPGVFTIGIQTSPWRMYDADNRIVTIDEMAASIRKQRPESDRRVHLVGSWSAKRPDGGSATLAKRLSEALGGLPVDGSDGFLWLSPTGAMRTTHQAFSIWKTGVYQVKRPGSIRSNRVPMS